MRVRRQPTKPGQESVWDYPRPPRLERVPERVRIVFAALQIADTSQAFRILETSHPPVYYLPPEDIALEHLVFSGRRSFCEWKGEAHYVHLGVGDRFVEDVGWFYRDPRPAFRPIRNHIAFYAGPMDACSVDDEIVQPQPGGFYGGWITSRIVGPFKGEPETSGW